MKSDYLPLKTFRKLFIYMQYENALAVEVSLEAGLRIGDVLKLQKGNLQGRTLVYRAEKTGKIDKKIISTDLACRLKRNSSGGWLFPSVRAQSGHRSREAVWKDIRRAARLAGVEAHATPHSARKTYAVIDYHKHGFKAVQEDLQHDNPSTTTLYAFADKLSEQEQEQEIEKLIERVSEGVARKILEYL